VPLEVNPENPDTSNCGVLGRLRNDTAKDTVIPQAVSAPLPLVSQPATFVSHMMGNFPTVRPILRKETVPSFCFGGHWRALSCLRNDTPWISSDISPPPGFMTGKVHLTHDRQLLDCQANPAQGNRALILFRWTRLAGNLGIHFAFFPSFALVVPRSLRSVDTSHEGEVGAAGERKLRTVLFTRNREDGRA
jgi:hypothetical protein